MGKKKRRAGLATAMAAVMVAALFGVASADHVDPGPPTTTLDVQPEGIHGNPTCADVTDGEDFLFEFKIEPVESGTFPITHDGLSGSVEIDVHNTAQGQAFDFEFTGDFLAATVVAKGGPNANLYDYLEEHAPGASADTFLHAPVNPNNNRFFGLSHISFCIAEAPTFSLLVEKVDHKNEPLAGAEFALYEDETGTTFVGDLDVVDDHLHCIDGLADGTYWVQEEKTPEHFEPSDPFEVTTTSTQDCDERVEATGDIIGDGPDLVVQNEPEPVDLIVTKWKVTLDGEGNLVRSDTPLEGFEYTLHEGSDDTGTVVDVQTTNSDGEAIFDNLEVGTQYTVCETDQADPSAYWTEADPPCQTFTPTLGTDVELDFDNEPLSRVEILFFDQTGFTTATIACVDGDGNPVGDPIQHEDADEAEELDHLPLGDYDCTIEVRNGGNGNGNGG